MPPNFVLAGPNGAQTAPNWPLRGTERCHVR